MKDVVTFLKEYSGIIAFLIVIFVVIYVSRKNIQNFHPEGDNMNTQDASIEEKLITISEKIQNYMDTSKCMPNDKKKEMIGALGMEAHHIDEMDTKGTKINTVANLIHKDVAHDLLRTHYVLDVLLKIQDSELNKREQYQNLIKDIEETPDKNFKPESKEKLVKIIKELM